jgi:uncharacterized protein involved in exopolysaccharide biosynthesis
MTGDNRDVAFVDLVRAAWRDWKLIVGATFAAAIVAAIVSLVVPEKFEGIVATVDADQGQAGNLSAAMLGQLGGLAGLAGFDLSKLGDKSGSARAVLRSHKLVEEFISRNNLLPELYADDWDAASGRWRTSPDDTPTLWLGVRKFVEDVYRIEEDPTTGVITLTVEWEDPVKAAAWANGLVALANQIVRSRDLEEAEKSVQYLQGEILKTNIVGLQQVLYSLIESEMQTIMLAKVKEEYAFSIVDPAVVADLRSFPHRSLFVVVGAVLGGFIGVMIVLVRLVLRRDLPSGVPA